jgi:hypothetical protein
MPHARNILPLKARLAAMGAGDGLCGQCGVPEDTRHLFQQYTRVADLWDGLYSRLARELPAVPSDLDLLLLDFKAASPLQRGWWWPTSGRLSLRCGGQGTA